MRGFSNGRELSSFRKIYARQVMAMEESPTKPISNLEDEPGICITFFNKDVVWVLPHENELMVIKVQCDDLEIKRVLIDSGNSFNIMYWDVFERLKLYPSDL